MKLGVISDTHARTFDEIPSRIILALGEVDLIVHAGDFTEKAVLDGLKTLGEVKAVCGNMDYGELKRILPPQDLFLAGGKRVGLIHGSGASWGLAGRVRDKFDDADIIIYGHSHTADKQYIRGALLFNPGRARNSFGILTIDDEIKAEIVTI